MDIGWIYRTRLMNPKPFTSIMLDPLEEEEQIASLKAPQSKCGWKNRSRLGALFATTFLVGWSFFHRSPSLAVDWKPCAENHKFLCGYLNVPTDYSNPSLGTSRLALTKYPANCSTSERLGIVITNYGGPGGPGRDISFQHASEAQQQTGGRYDIISFDQRGLGHSIPKVDCFGSALSYEVFKANTVHETTFSVPKDPFSSSGKGILVEQQKQALALEEAQATVCGNTMGAETLGYMSTTTTIYDMEEISRVLEGKDALINFWGGSYGSIVGAYLGHMLPHKAGRILISGIVPADMWANEHYESQVLLRLLLTDSEKTYQWYLEDCANAGPTRCALSNYGDSGPKDIEKRIDAFLDKLQDQPMIVSNHSRPGILTSGGVRQTLFVALQAPGIWSRYARMLASAINDDNGAPLLRMVTRELTEASPPQDSEGYTYTGQEPLLRLAISCGDARPYGKNEKRPTAGEIVDSILETMKESPRFGATVHLMEQHGGCQFWPGTGVGPERYFGPFNKTLATRTLILSNTHDPITPYAAGKIVQRTMGASSHLLVQGSAGHSYLSPTTECATKIIQQYFVQGILPDGSESKCEREVKNIFVDVEESTLEKYSKWE
ncbi:TAP-like protein-domain-containing protein [Collybia nuda]|uniref:TAP-like protein-domain-containing protein n=1 Tax=Collybia nuda TaxID=64659 RepID=A0A9P5YB81_9AGAR|nr:TAP-like protein-domain-containing protein [Collybia nuda]